MSALGIGPSVMINRLVHEARAPGNHLAHVARMRADLAAAVAREEATTALLNPAAADTTVPVVTGADVDRLV